jgi:hypothetical protein
VDAADRLHPRARLLELRHPGVLALPLRTQEVFRGCPAAAKYPFGSFEREEVAPNNGGWGEIRRRDGTIIKQ